MQQPVYSVKFNNGTWKLFNNFHFFDHDTFALQKDAVQAAAYMNNRVNKITNPS